MLQSLCIDYLNFCYASFPIFYLNPCYMSVVLTILIPPQLFTETGAGVCQRLAVLTMKYHAYAIASNLQVCINTLNRQNSCT